jgi:hypothetical protein
MEVILQLVIGVGGSCPVVALIFTLRFICYFLPFFFFFTLYFFKVPPGVYLIFVLSSVYFVFAFHFIVKDYHYAREVSLIVQLI